MPCVASVSATPPTMPAQNVYAGRNPSRRLNIVNRPVAAPKSSTSIPPSTSQREPEHNQRAGQIDEHLNDVGPDDGGRAARTCR